MTRPGATSTVIGFHWSDCDIPTTLVQSRIAKKVEFLHKKYLALKKRTKRKNFDTMKAEFLKMMDALFDVATCKCEDSESCRCRKTRKTPQLERTFLQNQRTERTMVVAGRSVAILFRTSNGLDQCSLSTGLDWVETSKRRRVEECERIRVRSRSKSAAKKRRSLSEPQRIALTPREPRRRSRPLADEFCTFESESDSDKGSRSESRINNE